MRISDWSSDVCSSDLLDISAFCPFWRYVRCRVWGVPSGARTSAIIAERNLTFSPVTFSFGTQRSASLNGPINPREARERPASSCAVMSRSEDHTSDLQSLMSTSYADFSLEQKKKQ